MGSVIDWARSAFGPGEFEYIIALWPEATGDACLVPHDLPPIGELWRQMVRGDRLPSAPLKVKSQVSRDDCARFLTTIVDAMSSVSINAAMLDGLITLFTRLGDFPSAREFLDGIVDGVSPELVAVVDLHRARVHVHLGESKDANRFYCQAARRRKAQGELHEAARCQLERLCFQRGLGAFVLAEEAYQEAMDLVEPLDDVSALKLELQLEYAVLLSARGERLRAPEILAICCDRSTSAHDVRVEGRSRAQLALIFAAAGEVDRAIETMEVAERRLAKGFSLGELVDWSLLRARVMRMAFRADDGRRGLEAVYAIAMERGCLVAAARMLSGLSALAYRQGNLAGAFSLCRRALKMEKRFGRPCRVAQLRYRFGNIFRAQGRLAKAHSSLERSLDAFESAGHVDGSSRCLLALAGVAHASGQDRESLELLERCRMLRNEVGDRLGVAQVLGEEATVHRDRGDLDRAADLYNHSVELRSDAGDNYGRAVVLNDLAMVYRYRGEYERAMALYEESLETKRQIGDRYGQALGLNDLALALKDRGALNEAASAVDAGLRIAESIDAGVMVCRLRANRAHLLAFFGQSDFALDELRSNLKQIRVLGCRAEEPKTLGVLSEIYRIKGRYAPAVRALERCQKLAQLRDDKRELAFVLIQRAQLEADRENYFAALDNLLACKKLRQDLGEVRGVAEVLWREAVVHSALDNVSAREDVFDNVEKLAREYHFPQPLLAARCARAVSSLSTSDHDEESVSQAESLLAEADDMEYLEGLHWAYRLLGLLHVSMDDPSQALRYFGRAFDALETGAWGGGRKAAERQMLQAVDHCLGIIDEDVHQLAEHEGLDVRFPEEGPQLLCVHFRDLPMDSTRERLRALVEVDSLVMPRLLSNHGELVEQYGSLLFMWFLDPSDAQCAREEVLLQAQILERTSSVSIGMGQVPCGDTLDAEVAVPRGLLALALHALPS